MHFLLRELKDAVATSQYRMKDANGNAFACGGLIVGGEDFDPKFVIATYRDVVLERDQSAASKDRRQLDRRAVRVRKFWAQWQGEDSLHEMALGEPVERTAIIVLFQSGTTLPVGHIQQPLA